MANYQSAYTGAQIDTAVAKINNFIDVVYPVGSVYININSTSPATLFGGTWQAISGAQVGSTTVYAWRRTA